jgi:ABC-2 type transport system permease protein
MEAVQPISSSAAEVSGQSARAAARPGLLLPAMSLCRREIVRFLRQRNRIIGALATPIVFWLMIGGGMGSSFSGGSMPGGNDYMQYFYPGTILMILLFTAIFSTISIIEDRHEGFLQSVLVAPVSRMSIVLGKVLGGTMLAFLQGLIFLVLAPTVGIHLTLLSFGITCFMMFLIGFALTALGVCLAWKMTSTQGFHAIMNLFLLPMWFLSGAMFPADKVHFALLRWIMLANPLTWGMDALRRGLYVQGGLDAALPSLLPGIIVSIVFAALLFLLASVLVNSRNAADL